MSSWVSARLCSTLECFHHIFSLFFKIILGLKYIPVFLDVSLFEWSSLFHSDYSESHENEYAKVYVPESLGILKLSLHILCSYILLLSSLISLTIDVFMVISFSVCTESNVLHLICVQVLAMCIRFYLYVPKSTELSLHIFFNIY